MSILNKITENWFAMRFAQVCAYAVVLVGLMEILFGVYQSFRSEIWTYAVVGIVDGTTKVAMGALIDVIRRIAVTLIVIAKRK